MTDRPFQVGLVALPHPPARLHLSTLETLPNVEAVHLCRLAGEDVTALAGGMGKADSTTTDLTTLRAQPEVASLLVFVRNDLCPVVLEVAVAAGKPVLFEKPGALRAADLQHVAGLARARHLTLGEH